MAEPFAPHRARRQCGERGNLRHRHVAQMFEVENLAIDSRHANVVVLELGAPEFQLRAKPAETPLPALATADNGGVDQQSLPSPRRAQCAFDHRHRIGGMSTLGCWRRARRPPVPRAARRRPIRGRVRRSVRGSSRSGSGTCASERYSAKRRAERCSAAQASSASSARPPGSGRVAPRAKQAGIAARSSASSRYGT